MDDYEGYFADGASRVIPAPTSAENHGTFQYLYLGSTSVMRRETTYPSGCGYRGHGYPPYFYSWGDGFGHFYCEPEVI
jgi:hypothetical protein